MGADIAIAEQKKGMSMLLLKYGADRTYLPPVSVFGGNQNLLDAFETEVCRGNLLLVFPFIDFLIVSAEYDELLANRAKFNANATRPLSYQSPKSPPWALLKPHSASDAATRERPATESDSAQPGAVVPPQLQVPSQSAIAQSVTTPTSTAMPMYHSNLPESKRQDGATSSVDKTVK